MARKRFDDEEDDDDDRPRRSRRRDDDDDDYDERPRRRKRKSKPEFPTWAWVAIPIGILFVIGICYVSLRPAIQKARSNEASGVVRINMKQIGIGLHSQHDVQGFFGVPFAVSDDKATNPGLSWRVGLLPYVEQNGLYRGFDRSSRWDDPRNIAFSSQLVSAYSTPDEPGGPTNTRMFGFNGPGAFMEANRKFPMKLSNISDGTANTAMAAEVTIGAPWASPTDVPYTRNGPLPSFGASGSDSFQILLADGSVRNIKKTISPAVMHLLIQIADGQPVNLDEL